MIVSISDKQIAGAIDSDPGGIIESRDAAAAIRATDDSG